MAYPQKLLSDGETVEFEMRPHWRALVWPGVILLLLAFGLVFLMRKVNEWFAGSTALDSVTSWLLVLVGAFIFVVFVIRPFLYWVTTQYVFTNRRIIVRSGLIARHGRDMPLSKVNNVSFDVTVPGRVLNYGMLTIDSASDEALIINDVPSVEHIQREVNRLHEEDDERRRRNIAAEYAPPPSQPAPYPSTPTEPYPRQQAPTESHRQPEPPPQA